MTSCKKDSSAEILSVVLTQQVGYEVLASDWAVSNGPGFSHSNMLAITPSVLSSGQKS